MSGSAIRAISIICIAYLAIYNCRFADARPQLFGFETLARWVNDGRAFLNEFKASTLESVAGSRSFRKRLVFPRRFRRTQPRSNSIEFEDLSSKLTSSSAYTIDGRPMTAKERRQFEKSLMESFAMHGGMRRGFLRPRNNQGRGNGRARTVDSPALSVDSGGHSKSHAGLTNTISKVFHSDQGHYADIYDQIDKEQTLPTWRPIELIDGETVEHKELNMASG